MVLNLASISGTPAGLGTLLKVKFLFIPAKIESSESESETSELLFDLFFYLFFFALTSSDESDHSLSFSSRMSSRLEARSCLAPRLQRCQEGGRESWLKEIVVVVFFCFESDPSVLLLEG